jgi:hypothetical protein
MEEQEDLVTIMKAASQQLGKDLTTHAIDSSMNQRNGHEMKYAQAYQSCVKAGIYPQLRKKYR